MIPDHALPADEQDLFDHDDYVDRLVGVIEHASIRHSSANIALFGSWGSGKSGVANRLRARLRDRRHLHYVDFDAFKFARQPLLRNFITRLADELLEQEAATELKRQLYEERSTSTLKLPKLSAKWARGLKALGVVFGLVFGLSLGLALFGSGGRQDFGVNFLSSIPALLSSALLIGLVGFALRYLTVTTASSPAGSEEQFEEIFNGMLVKLGITGESGDRLVVFIDELDRCSPAEVASTLQSIRTFLGAKGCVFVVAADQQVLEHALTQKVRQSTPPDLANPYYSAGNAYLDKIFQYQLAFPPLRPRRLTRYALELIQGRSGVWAAPDVDHEEVVSVLLPTHVQSPRRVKVLLNGFALSYGVAQVRAARGTLPPMAPRAAELAKLVCLKTEFPLFARDLNLDPRLTDAVLKAAATLGAGGDVDDALADLPWDLRQRAAMYATGELPAAQLLSSRVAAQGGDDEESQIPTDEEDEESGGETVDQADMEEPDVAEEPDVDARSIQARHAIQLVRYLEKTTDIDGPGSDLIYLESPGAIWGLDAKFAQDLEQNALDNRATAVARTVRNLPGDDRSNALLMLGRLARESVGQDADNVVRCLLAAIAAADIPLDSIAARLVGDLESFDERRGLSSAELPGALALALAAKRGSLVARLLARDEAVEDASFVFNVLAHAGALLPEHHERLTQVLAAGMAEDAGRTAQILQGLDQTEAAKLLEAATPRVTAAAEEHRTEADRLDTAGDAEGAEREREALRGIVAEVSGLASSLLQERPILAEFASLSLFDIHPGYASDSYFAFVDNAAPLKTQAASLAVLREMSGWELEKVQRLITGLDAEVIASAEGAGEAFGQFANHLWTELRGGTDSLPSELRAELQRITSMGLEAVGTEAPEAIAADLVRRLDSDPVKEEFNRMESLAEDMSRFFLVSRGAVATASLRTVAQTLRPPPPPAGVFEITQAIRGSAGWLGADADVEVLHETLDAVRADDCWVEPIERYTIQLYVLGALHRAGQDIETPTLDEFKEAVETGVASAEAAGIWLEHFAANPTDAFTAVSSFISSPPEKLCDSLESFAADLGPVDLAELAAPAVRRAFELQPAKAFFEAVRFDEANEREIANALVELAARSENQDQREQVLDIWSWLDPTSRHARRMLIFDVFLPIAEAGTTGHELARRRLDLLAKPPSGTRDDIISRLAATAPDKKRAKQLERKMDAVGLSKRRKGFLKRALGLD